MCDRFAHAGSAAEARAYVTANFGPAVDAIYEAEDDGFEVAFELTDEAPAPPDVGGYLVGYRAVGPADEVGGPAVHMDGVFHRVDFGDGWKIEDMYITHIDGREPDSWVSFARDYRLMLAAPAGGPGRGGG